MRKRIGNLDFDCASHCVYHLAALRQQKRHQLQLLKLTYFIASTPTDQALHCSWSIPTHGTQAAFARYLLTLVCVMSMKMLALAKRHIQPYSAAREAVLAVRKVHDWFSHRPNALSFSRSSCRRVVDSEARKRSNARATILCILIPVFAL
jgi:hypothetical protein